MKKRKWVVDELLSGRQVTFVFIFVLFLRDGQCKLDTCAQSASSASVGAESTQILRGPCLTSKTRRRSPRSPKIDDPCRVFKIFIHSRDGMNEIRGIYDRPYGHVPRSRTRGR